MSYLDNSGVSYLWSKIKAAFAAKSHSHAAGDITSGTLDAARIPNLSTDKLTSGTLPVARGGTGATTAATARTNLDVVPNGAITPYVEATNILSDAYVGGDYVIVESSGFMYKVHSLVNRGDDISTASNVSRTTVADEIDRVSLDAEDALDGVNELNGIIGIHFPDGKLPVTYGGTGQDGTSYTAVVANVASAASGCTVTSGIYAQWGKVAQVFLGIKCDSAKAFNDTLATMTSGKRPVMTSVLTSTDGTVAFGVTTGGLVQAKSSISAGTTLYVIGTYLLP